jgi:hypothetical protein
MHRPTDTALKNRARTLLEAMTERSRWIYAVPRDESVDAVAAIASGAGLRRDGEGTRCANEAGTARLVVLDRPELDVMVIESAGQEAPPILSAVLEKTGFYAQSTLLGTAFDVHDEETTEALATLAHMVVAWDKEWRELFKLHLGADEPAVRRWAAEAVVIAKETAGDAGPAEALLDEALQREQDNEVKAAITAALGRVRGSAA